MGSSGHYCPFCEQLINNELIKRLELINNELIKRLERLEFVYAKVITVTVTYRPA